MSYMTGKRFKLLGHDNPFGYPAPVVPVGLLNDRLVAVYASDRVTELELEEDENTYIKHNESIRRTLKDFDYLQHRLFGFNENQVEHYRIDKEDSYFYRLLKNHKADLKNPFLRLSLAKATGKPFLSMAEMASCAKHLNNISPHIIESWYEKQLVSLHHYSGLASQAYLFPPRWEDLEIINIEEEQGTSRNVRIIKKFVYKALKQMHDLEMKKKVPRFQQKNSEGEFEVLVFLSQLERLLFRSLADVHDPIIYPSKVRYFNSLHNLVNKTEKCLQRDQSLEKGYVSNVLYLHTRLFNEILRKKLDLKWDSNAWRDMSLIRFRLWGESRDIPTNIVQSEPVTSYSYFISYSNQDEEFAKKLYSRLRESGLRVWFAPKDLRYQRKVFEQIEQAIRIYDKMLLVISDKSLNSEWVMDEIRIALNIEAREKRRKLYPIRLVDFETIQKWKFNDAHQKDIASEVRSYFIHDFSDWKNNDAFETAFERLARDLRASEIM